METITVKELIEVLQRHNGDCKVYFENYANGTYHSFQEAVIDNQGKLGDVILTNYAEIVGEQR